MHASLLAHLLACLLACSLVRLLACLLARLRACLLACSLACLRACLLACLLPRMLACLLTCFLAYFISYQLQGHQPFILPRKNPINFNRYINLLSLVFIFKENQRDVILNIIQQHFHLDGNIFMINHFKVVMKIL